MSPVSAPTAEFINCLATWTWLEETAVGQVAFLLLAHPEADTVAPQLVQLAERLGLAPPQGMLPDAGERVLVVDGHRAAVRIDGCPRVVLVEVGRRWAEFTRAGGRIAVAVGLAPLARRSHRADVEDYLGHGAMSGRLRLGTAWAHARDFQQP